MRRPHIRYTALLDWQLANRLKGEEYSEYASALSGMTARMDVGRAADIRPGLEESVQDCGQGSDLQRRGHEHSRLLPPGQRSEHSSPMP